MSDIRPEDQDDVGAPVEPEPDDDNLTEGPGEPGDDESEGFADEGAGPEEPDEVLDDPENKAAADAIRNSTLGDLTPPEAP